MAMRTQPEGLGVGLVVPVSTANGSSEPLGPTSPIIIGVNNLSSSKTTVDDYSDWTVTFSWSSNNNSFKATSGIAMPFLYFQKGIMILLQLSLMMERFLFITSCC